MKQTARLKAVTSLGQGRGGGVWGEGDGLCLFSL